MKTFLMQKGSRWWVCYSQYSFTWPTDVLLHTDVNLSWSTVKSPQQHFSVKINIAKRFLILFGDASNIHFQNDCNYGFVAFAFLTLQNVHCKDLSFLTLCSCILPHIAFSLPLLHEYLEDLLGFEILLAHTWFYHCLICLPSAELRDFSLYNPSILKNHCQLSICKVSQNHIHFELASFVKFCVKVLQETTVPWLHEVAHHFHKLSSHLLNFWSFWINHLTSLMPLKNHGEREKKRIGQHVLVFCVVCSNKYAKPVFCH